jgi:hypothetical protein
MELCSYKTEMISDSTPVLILGAAGSNNCAQILTRCKNVFEQVILYRLKVVINLFGLSF